MKKTWILVADNSRARIFYANSLMAPLVEIESFVHPASRQHEQELTSDLPGTDRYGSMHHSYSDETDPKKQESMVFARTVARHLDEARKQGRYGQLIVIAAPSFLGLMRANLSPATTKLVTMELDKNLARQNPEQIRHQLPKILPSLGV